MNDPYYPLSHSAEDLQAMMAHLAARHGLASLDAHSFASYASLPGDRVILLAEDPVRVPESWDAVVVFPEVLKAQAGRLEAGLLEVGAAREIAPRYGIRVLPALLFLRSGGYVGAIEGLRHWDGYLSEFETLLQRPAGRPPLTVQAVACR